MSAQRSEVIALRPMTPREVRVAVNAFPAPNVTHWECMCRIMPGPMTCMNRGPSRLDREDATAPRPIRLTTSPQLQQRPSPTLSSS